MNQRSQPGFLAAELFKRVVFGDHPAARVSPTPDSLEAFTRDTLVAFHKAHYIPDRAVARVRRRHHSCLGANRRSSRRSPAGRRRAQRCRRPASPRRSAVRSVYLVARPNSVQTSLVVGTQSIDADDPGLRGADRRQPRARRHDGARLFRICARRRATPTASAAASRRPASADRGPRIDQRAHGGHRPGADRPARRDRQMRDTPVPAEELAERQARDRRRIRASLESPTAMLSYYIDSWRLQAAGRLLGYVSGDDQRDHRGRRAGGGAEILGAGPSADRRGRRRRQDRAERSRNSGPLQSFDAEGKPVK